MSATIEERVKTITRNCHRTGKLQSDIFAACQHIQAKAGLGPDSHRAQSAECGEDLSAGLVAGIIQSQLETDFARCIRLDAALEQR